MLALDRALGEPLNGGANSRRNYSPACNAAAHLADIALVFAAQRPRQCGLATCDGDGSIKRFQ